MKKIVVFIIILLFFSFNYSLAKKEKEKPILILSSKDYIQSANDIKSIDFVKFQNEFYFKTNSKIYFFVYNPSGFKSDYIKYQIIKQNDNAYSGGFSRIRNVTVRIKDKNFYKDYFMLTLAGRYYIQIFDIENLQQWITIGSFGVFND